MLLVNNSPRCHLQSLFPAHFSLSGRFSPDSDWRNRGKDITCYANATGYFVASLPDSFLINLYTFFFFTTCPSSVFVWIYMMKRAIREFWNYILSPRLFLFFPVTCAFYHHHHPYPSCFHGSVSFPPSVSSSFRVKEKWKTLSPSRLQLVEKESKSWTEV